MKAVLFDLDDTLYPEIEFVKSGFKAVTSYLSSNTGIEEGFLLNRLSDIMRNEGRGKTFDILLQSLDLYTEERVRLMVYLYRSHRPSIALYPDVLPTLHQLRRQGMRLGLVTDGMAAIQRRKIEALELENLFDVIVCTDEIGREYWKPSTVPFKIALELLQVSPVEAVYVGDNINKDFVGASSLKMLTIQVIRHSHSTVSIDSLPEFSCPDFVVRGLDEIVSIIES